MTKFKKYLMAKGITLYGQPYNEYDFEINTCAGIETQTCVEIMDGCIVVVIYSNIADPEYAVYDRYGEHGWFNTNGDMSCVERFCCGPEYIDWLYGTDHTGSEEMLSVMRFMYCNDAEVRMAFKHMRAGIMNEEVFHRWLDKCCLRYMSILDL